jgi:hypothetical protein
MNKQKNQSADGNKEDDEPNSPAEEKETAVKSQLMLEDNDKDKDLYLKGLQHISRQGRLRATVSYLGKYVSRSQCI